MEDLYNTEMTHVINSGDYTIEEYLNAIEILVTKVRRKIFDNNIPIEDKIPAGVVNVDTVHRVIDTEVEHPAEIDASFLENEGTGRLSNRKDIGRNMNEEY